MNRGRTRRNSIGEDRKHVFEFNVVASSGSVERWSATYRNRDINQSGGAPTDWVNPFDILGPRRNQNEDQAIGGVSEIDYLRRTIIHEIGHALGMWPSSKSPEHPTSGHSVMRAGVGPGRSGSFDNRDIAQIDFIR